MKEKKPLWFHAKKYGYGWTPATWQGWLILGIWVAVFAGVTSALNVFLDFHWMAMVLSVVFGLVWMASLMWVSYRTGEKPVWRWGNTSTRNNRDNA